MKEERREQFQFTGRMWVETRTEHQAPRYSKEACGSAASEKPWGHGAGTQVMEELLTSTPYSWWNAQEGNLHPSLCF